ncbi:MAG: HupE/UreJ family protein [Woeseiaceae bacterium]|nr:HupE/UreJ family protein [Woeseiaceae bacterium]
MRTLTALILLALAGLACAHPEDEFCIPGEGGLDPALCEALNAMQSGNELRPLLDEQGNELGSLATARLYIGIGVGHILPGGLDHILFVLALFLTSTRLKALVLQVTMFTLAHSLTLGMAAAGWISLNSAWVEALIAATIAFVAIENVFVKRMPSWRLPVVFLFGLLHGLGFAGFFGELGLPENQFLAGLVGFNVGVEIGQIGVLLVALVVAFVLRRAIESRQLPESTYRRFVVLPATLVIAAVGSYWTVERLLAV